MPGPRGQRGGADWRAAAEGEARREGRGPRRDRGRMLCRLRPGGPRAGEVNTWSRSPVAGASHGLDPGRRGPGGQGAVAATQPLAWSPGPAPGPEQAARATAATPAPECQAEGHSCPTPAPPPRGTAGVWDWLTVLWAVLCADQGG